MEINRIERIFNLLSDEAFKDPNTGLLFFPVYTPTILKMNIKFVKKLIFLTIN
jgi:hypothetical protein